MVQDRWRGPRGPLRSLSSAVVEIPPPDPVKLLAQWMEWERGETNPGRVMANLKTGGMRELLEQLAAAVTTETA